MDNVEPEGLIGGKNIRVEHGWSNVAVSLLIRVSLVMSSSLETHLHPLPFHPTRSYMPGTLLYSPGCITTALIIVI